MGESRMFNRRDMLKTGVALGVGSSVANAQSEDGVAFSAGRMSGEQQSPSVQTDAQGTAMVVQEGESIRFVVLVSEIENVTQAHIHRGGAGESGPVVVWLYPGPKRTNPQLIAGRFDGVLSSGQFSAADFVGPLEGKPLDALVTAMEDGNAYVNVHTEANPEGEIRGQLSPTSDARVRFNQNIQINASNTLNISRSSSLQVQES
ncbi:CHRD domain-containing protein [Haladaptatus caseinilyticus]|uniref:CHRD domain-containing protein n=1 Tax=Haladaptatus caseinilyticus TaxID=2993314 RepID=UPI00224AC099|nr:CHRD domain-containing protein [Haladaptatus caseinilyticus]